jgi:LPS export ABC transporter protein LptC
MSRDQVSGVRIKWLSIVKELGLILMLVFIVGCSSNDDLKPTTTGNATEPDPPSQTGYNVQMNFSNEGVVRAVLTARRVRTYDTRRQTILDSSLKVDFYSPKAYHTNLLTAKRALIDDRTKNMIAYDSVRTKSDHGVLVETDSLVWDNMTRQIRSDAFVRITEKNGRITTGYGFESDQDLVNYRIKRPTITAPRSSIENINASPSLSPGMQTTTGTGLPLVTSPVERDTTSK